MNLKNASFDEFGEKIKAEKRKIILFGAGTLFASWIKYALEEQGLADHVQMITDNSSEKLGKAVSIGEKRFLIESPREIAKHAEQDAVILIVSSYFAAMIEQLDAMSELADTACYVAPIMHITHAGEKDASIEPYKKRERGIPKVIHYCWFGRKTIPDRNKACIESWKKYCPDYEIVEWNEDNYDVRKNRYMGQAYEAGKYGYVPDYARIDILHQYGGIYLDTDVEMIRSFDELLPLEAFTSFEEYPTVNFGGGSGCVKGFPLLENILAFREKIDFINPDGTYNTKTCGYYETVPLIREGLKLTGKMQNVQGLTVLPSDYFHPKSSVTGQTTITENTYSIHQFNWSWVDTDKMTEKNRTHKEYETILKKMEQNR